MDDELFEFVLGEAVGLGAGEVPDHRLGAASGYQSGDGDEAEVAWGHLVPFPDVAEEHLLGEGDQLETRSRNAPVSLGVYTGQPAGGHRMRGERGLPRCGQPLGS